jgi:hypothetical protein
MKTIYLNIIRRVFPRNIENYVELGKSILDTRFTVRQLREVGFKYLAIVMSNKRNLILNIWRYFENRIFYISEQSLVSHVELIDVSTVELIDVSTPSVLVQLSPPHYSIIYNYYRDDLELVNYMGPVIRILASEAEEVQLTNNNDVNRKYNIIPILRLEENEEKEEMCAICYESIKCDDLVSLNCSHKFCSSCIIGILKTTKQPSPTCALCREVIRDFKVKKIEIYNSVKEYCNLFYLNG